MGLLSLNDKKFKYSYVLWCLNDGTVHQDVTTHDCTLVVTIMGVVSRGVCVHICLSVRPSVRLSFRLCPCVCVILKP